MGRQFHIVCSHAVEDRAACLRLEKQIALLLKQGGHRYWHEGLIMAGEQSRAMIDGAIDDADVILVLVSHHYLASEACLAQLDRACQRLEFARVVPVLLSPADWTETGLAPLEPLPADRIFIAGRPDGDAAWQAVAVGIKALLKALEEAPFGPRPTYRRVVTEAFRLDRIKQWEQIQRRCAAAEHTFFLLHGRQGQAVGLFADRVFRLLEQTRGLHHLRVQVPLRKMASGARVNNGGDLVTNLRGALLQSFYGGADPGQAATEAGTAKLLERVTRRQPLFLVLGAAQRGTAWPEVEREALKDFVGVRLQGLLPAAGHRVQTLMMLEYADEQDSLVSWVDGWAAGLGQRYCKLLPAELPSWDEVEEILRRRGADADTIAAILEFYERLQKTKNPSFEELADALDEHLE